MKKQTIEQQLEYTKKLEKRGFSPFKICYKNRRYYFNTATFIVPKAKVQELIDATNEWMELIINLAKNWQINQNIVSTTATLFTTDYSKKMVLWRPNTVGYQTQWANKLNDKKIVNEGLQFVKAYEAGRQRVLALNAILKTCKVHQEIMKEEVEGCEIKIVRNSSTPLSLMQLIERTNRLPAYRLYPLPIEHPYAKGVAYRAFVDLLDIKYLTFSLISAYKKEDRHYYKLGEIQNVQ